MAAWAGWGKPIFIYLGSNVLGRMFLLFDKWL